MFFLGLVAELSFAPVHFKAAVAFRALVGLQSHRVIDRDREQLTAVGAVDFGLTCDRPGEADLVRQEVVEHVHYDLPMPGVAKDLGGGGGKVVEVNVKDSAVFHSVYICKIRQFSKTS